ncbi:MAG: response regulator [Alphaproteobacteria bacterium]|nr:response regulator [Alphaproteobacteria bacterium]MCB9930008.1 response regulator [Alphaproteobacteria bacterium]
MMDEPHILVVDDHRDIRDALAKYLDRNGYRVSQADSAAAARRVMRDAAIDLVVLDIMMPGEDGLSLTRDLRAQGQLPIILLTAVAEETDRIVGLEMGADDYLTKPFNPRELLARIKAVLRRTQALPPQPTDAPQGLLRFDRWVADPAAQSVADAEGAPLDLSTAEFRLLYAFLTHPQRVLSRDQLLDLTQGRTAVPFDRSIDNMVSRLRRKIEVDPKKPQLIKTHWGGGYALAVPVEPA